jgi:hypothetical protein
VGTTNDFAGVGEVGSFGCGTEGQFWNMNGTPQIVGQFSNSPSSPNANGQPIFTQPAAGTFTQQKGVRDSIYGPGFRDWNLGLFKKFAITERHGLEFRAEAFDVDNHANWTEKTGTGGTSGFFNPTSSSFGKVTAKTQLSRNLQLSLRYSF